MSWAIVVAGRGAAQQEAHGAAEAWFVTETQSTEKGAKGAGDTKGKLVTTGLTHGADATVAPPSAWRTEQPRGGRQKRGRGNWTGRTVEVAGVGKLPLDLLDEVLFEVLARVPITELQRLLRQKVSRRFVAAIKSVFLEMASQAVRRACELDEQGAVGDSPYEQAFKIWFTVCPPFNYPRGIDEAYSARDCHWRPGRCRKRTR
jgi:hypothetical protein